MTLQQQAQFFAANDYCARREIVESAYAEALLINRLFDEQVRWLHAFANEPEAAAAWIDSDHAFALAWDALGVTK